MREATKKNIWYYRDRMSVPRGPCPLPVSLIQADDTSIDTDQNERAAEGPTGQQTSCRRHLSCQHVESQCSRHRCSQGIVHHDVMHAGAAGVLGARHHRREHAGVGAGLGGLAANSQCAHLGGTDPDARGCALLPRRNRLWPIEHGTCALVILLCTPCRHMHCYNAAAACVIHGLPAAVQVAAWVKRTFALRPALAAIRKQRGEQRQFKSSQVDDMY